MRQEIPEYDFRLSYTADVWNVGDRIPSPVNDDSGNQFRFKGTAEVVMTTYSCEAGKQSKRFFYVRVYPAVDANDFQPSTITLEAQTVPKDLAEDQRKAFRGETYKNEIDLIQ